MNCPELNCPDKGMFSPVFTDSCKNAGFLASHYQCRLFAPCWSNKNKQMMDFPGGFTDGLGGKYYWAKIGEVNFAQHRAFFEFK